MNWKSNCLITLIGFTLVFIPQLISAQSSSQFSKIQLEMVNQEWKTKSLGECSLIELLNSNQKLKPIQIHLLLVAEELSKEKNSNLLIQSKRKELIEVLKQYALAGQFPINTNHSYRIPYFIDDFGTACAVGHLIIQSGHAELAKKIAKESNNLYIREMNYNAVDDWANEHGFSEDELAWIQPGYGPRCPLGTYWDACHGSNYGCIYPNFSNAAPGPAQQFYTQYSQDSITWTTDSINWWTFSSGEVPIGYVRVVFVDSLGIRHERNYHIKMRDSISLNTSLIASQANHCDGEVRLSPTNVRQPVQYYISNNQLPHYENAQTPFFDSLCPAIYHLYLFDANACSAGENIDLRPAVGIDETQEEESFSISPNPVSDHFKIIAKNDQPIEFRLFNASGKLIMRKMVYSNDNINIKGLKSGAYFIDFILEGKHHQKQIIKL